MDKGICGLQSMGSQRVGHDGTVYMCEVKVTQLYLTICNPMDYKVHGILQARTLEWVAVPFSRGSSQPRGQT